MGGGHWVLSWSWSSHHFSTPDLPYSDRKIIPARRETSQLLISKVAHGSARAQLPRHVLPLHMEKVEEFQGEQLVLLLIMPPARALPAQVIRRCQAH